MILTVTLNPMLDKTVLLDRLRPGTIHRASAMGAVVGGKGVNVSRQLLFLGSRSLATGFAGGETGRALRRMLSEEGIPERFVTIGGQTREGVTYREANGRVSAVFEPPHQVRSSEARELRDRCRSLLTRASWVVCSGSSPCRQTDTLFRLILRDARERGVRTALDSYGPALAQAVASRPTLLKANREEYESTFDTRLRSTREIKSLLGGRIRYGSEICIITDGARAVHASGEGRFYRILPPATRSVNPTGSGDSMLAGILLGLERGWDLARSLVFGVAAGVANASVWAVAAGRPATIAHIARAVHIEEV